MSAVLGRWSFLGLLLSAACLAASAAPSKAGSTNAPANPVWPPPPDAPRLRYESSINGPADIGRSRSFWTKVSDLVTGSAATKDNLLKPFALAVDEQGNLGLTDSGLAVVCWLDFAHKSWQRWDRVGTNRFRSPVALAAQAGVFYVADSELGKVLAFRDPKQPIFEIAAPLQRPAAVALAQDTLFVADPPAHAVFAFDLRGQLRFQFGKRGAGPGEFNYPTHLAVGPHQNLYVTDSMNCRIEVFDAAGKFVRSLGSAGDSSGHLSRPKGVAADARGNVFVVDALFDNVQLFDGEGRLLLYWGAAGSGPGEFWLPNGIALAPQGRLYVADTFNHRIQVFERLGQE